jgi:hypothetical protein
LFTWKGKSGSRRCYWTQKKIDKEIVEKVPSIDTMRNNVLNQLEEELKLLRLEKENLIEQKMKSPSNLIIYSNKVIDHTISQHIENNILGVSPLIV